MTGKIEFAKFFISQGRIEDAKGMLHEVINANPDSMHAHFEMGKILQIEGNDQGAEIEYKKVVSLDTSFSEAHLELARIYYRQKRFDLAMERYRQVTDAHQTSGEAFREMGKLWDDMGNFGKAVESLECAVRLCPGNIDILSDLARTYREGGKEKEAAETFRKILAAPQVIESKFLHNKFLNELEITERKEVLESKLRAMIAMVLDRCNIRCRICHIWEGSWQARDSIMKEITDLFPYMEEICWEGGEVFLMKGFDEILGEGAKHKNLKQIIFTNGLLLTENILAKLNQGNADIVFSIDAVHKDTYEYIRRGGKFEKLVKNLEMVREFRKKNGSNINIYLNPIIMKSNYQQMEDIVAFGKEYGFNAVTFTPLRGEFADENIFELKNETALQEIRQSLVRISDRSKEYGIRVNNWLPVEESPCGCDSPLPGVAAHDQDSKDMGMQKNARMICYSPWQRLTIDSGGPARPFAFCLNKFVGSTDLMSLAEIWNGAGMRYYRRKIATGDFADLCQPECISGQVRDKICRIV